MKRSFQARKRRLTVFACLLLFLTACSQNKQADPAGSGSASGGSASAGYSVSGQTMPPVELVWYYPQPNAQSDLGAVESALNEITKAKINATVKLKPIDFGEYNEKMNTVAASGEAFDIAWTANWLFDYVGNVNKGVFIPLDELLNEYGSELKAALPDFMWDQVKVNGHIYGVPSYQSVTGRQGYIIPKDYIDKYALDIASIKKFEDIEPFLAKIAQSEPGVAPLGMNKAGMFGYFIHALGFDIIPVTDNPPIGFHSTDASLQLMNVYATPEYKHYLEVVRGWYQKGYINKDSPTVKGDGLDRIAKQGKVVVTFSNGLNPASETAVSQKRYNGRAVAYIALTDFIVEGNPGIATVNGIGKNSKNPERAMMFLNLLNTDKRLYNTIAYGIEGKHYDKAGDNSIKIKESGGYAPNSSWIYGNTFNGFLQEGQPADTFEVQKKTNAEAKPTLNVGFRFDPAPVMTEIANLQSVLEEYMPGLNTGAIDPDKKLPDMLDRMQKAGIDKVIQEAQKQIDAWKASK